MSFTPEFRGAAEMLVDMFVKRISDKKNLENILEFYHIDRKCQYFYVFGFYHASMEAEIRNMYLARYKKGMDDSDLKDTWEIIKRREKEVDRILTGYGIGSTS